MPRPRASALAAIGAVLLVAAFYTWTAATSGTLFGPHPRSAYGKLADAFLHAQLNLRQQAPPGLAALPDPYDPNQNVGFRGPQVDDLSYYHGRLYAYWGPVPVLLLYLPAKAAGIALSDQLVALVLGLVGLLAWAAVIHVLIQRLPRPPPPWMEPVALVAVGLGDYVPFLVRVSRVYEIAIASGVCFTGLGVLALVLALRRPRVPAMALAAASAAFGLAFASRPTLLALAAPLAAVFVYVRRQDPDGDRRRLAVVAAALALPFASCVAAYAVYNHARFGSFTEFGLRYQLSSYDLYHRSYFRPGDMLAGLAAYIATPIRLVAQFPFAWPQVARVAVPNGFYVEDRAGLLMVAPLVLCLPAAWWARDPRPRLLVAALAAGAGIVAALTALAVAGAPIRYTADFAPALVAAAAVAWCSAAARRGRAARRWRRAGTVLAALTMLAGVLVSMSVEKAFLTSRPGQFTALENAFAFVPQAAALFADRPIQVGVDHQPRPDPDQVPPNDFDSTPAKVLTVASPKRHVVAVSYLVRAAFNTGAMPRRMVVAPEDGPATTAPIDLGGRAVRISVPAGLTSVSIRTANGHPVVFERLGLRRAN